MVEEGTNEDIVDTQAVLVWAVRLIKRLLKRRRPGTKQYETLSPWTAPIDEVRA